jgi:hypothetical protein
MEKDTLVFIKLITGGYTIGKVINDTETELELKKPLSVIFEPMMGGLQILPYDAYYLGKEVNELSFKKDQIMHVFEGEDIPLEIEAKFREFESGIVTAPAGSEDQAAAQAQQLANALGIQ